MYFHENIRNRFFFSFSFHVVGFVVLDIVIACLRDIHAGAYDVTQRKCKVLSTICCRTGLHLVHVIFIHFLSSRPDTYFVFHHFHSFDGTFDSLPTSREVVSATRTHILEDDFVQGLMGLIVPVVRLVVKCIIHHQPSVQIIVILRLSHHST